MAALTDAAAPASTWRTLAAVVFGIFMVTLDGFARAYVLSFWLAVAGLLLGVVLPGWPGRWPAPAEPVVRREANAVR